MFDIINSVCLLTFSVCFHVLRRKWRQMWEDTYTTRSIGQEANFPLLYSPDGTVKWFCETYKLDKVVQVHGAPPQWMIHNSVSWIKRLDFDHFRSAFSGIVHNKELFAAIDQADNHPFFQTQAEAICGNGKIMKNKQAVVKESLSMSSTLCLESYNYEKSSDDTKIIFGRCASMLSSSSHKNAAVIGYKIAPPTMLPVGPALTPPWQGNDDGPVDLEVSIIFRGSESAADWITNVAFSLSDTANEPSLPSLRTHSGFLNRHKRMWPCILEDIRRIENNLKQLPGFHLNRIRFALGGHSQGGALSTLTALALSKEFPLSPIRLFTYSSPAIFEFDPLTNTCIRHIRFAVDNDFIAMQLLGRQHGGSRCITINGKNVGLNPVGAHYMDKYKVFIEQICRGNFDSIA